MNQDAQRWILIGGLMTSLAVAGHAEITPNAAAGAPSDTEVFMTLTKTPVKATALPTTAEIIRPEQFESWSPQTAGDIVARLTDVQVRPVGGLATTQNVKVRGSTTNENLVLIDGRPVGGVAFASSQDLAEIPVEAIDHIEVVRGGVSALYGPNATSGVINIITRRAVSDEKPALSAGYELGSYGRAGFRGSVAAKNGPTNIFVYGDRHAEGGFRVNSDAATLSAGGNAGVSLGKAGNLSFQGSTYQAEFGVPGQFVPDIPTNQYDNHIERQAVSATARQDTRTETLRAAYNVALPADSKLSIATWGSTRRVLFKDIPSFVNTSRYEYSHGVEAQADLPLGLTVGGNFIHDREDSADYITPSNTFFRHVENYAFFAQDTMKWKAITLIPGGRYDHHSQFGETWNPRTQLLLDATDWLRFSGSAARSFRAPTIDESIYPYTDFGSFFGTDFAYAGNPSLKPEKAWTYDAGFEAHADDWSFKTTFFRANVSNLIQAVTVFTPGAGVGGTDLDLSTNQNVGHARRQGVEIQLDHRVNRYFKDTLNYTYLDNRGVLTDGAPYVDLAYSPRHTVNYTAAITPFKNWEWDHTVRYESSQFSDNNNAGSKLSSRVLWDMRLAYKWNQLESFFQIHDITDKRYEEQAGYPLPGRTFIGGVTWKYE